VQRGCLAMQKGQRERVRLFKSEIEAGWWRMRRTLCARVAPPIGWKRVTHGLFCFAGLASDGKGQNSEKELAFADGGGQQCRR